MRFWSWLVGERPKPPFPVRHYTDEELAALTAREREFCDICSGRKKFYCSICYAEIANHSHEGDFICEEHDLVRPISEESLRALVARLDALRGNGRVE